MEDFESSAVRHFEDAEWLLSNGRLDNAGHLFGISGECSVKAVCQQEGQDKPSLHFASGGKKDLRDRAPQLLVGRKGSKIIAILPKVFQGWNVEQRYQRTGTTTQAEIAVWRADAVALLNALQGM